LAAIFHFPDGATSSNFAHCLQIRPSDFLLLIRCNVPRPKQSIHVGLLHFLQMPPPKVSNFFPQEWQVQGIILVIVCITRLLENRLTTTKGWFPGDSCPFPSMSSPYTEHPERSLFLPTQGFLARFTFSTASTICVTCVGNHLYHQLDAANPRLVDAFVSHRPI
jgi:hypothetical protein